MLQVVRAHRIFALGAIVYALILAFLPLQRQAMETYAYSAAIEGYYNLSKTFNLYMQSEQIPDISRWHPNHPLPGFFAGIMYDHFGISALNWFRGWNLFWAIGLITVFYRFMLTLKFSNKTSALGALLLGITHGIWTMALSAETHLPALALAVVAADYLVKYLLDGAPGKLLCSAMIFSLATGFHLAAGLLVIPAFLALLSHGWRKEYAGAAAAFIAGFLFFYLLCPVVILRIGSIHQFNQTLLMYKHLVHQRYEGLYWFWIAMLTFLRSIIYIDAAQVGSAIVVLILTLYTIWTGARNLIAVRPVRILLIGVPLTYLFSHMVLGARPDGVNGWLFTLPALLALFAAAFAQGRGLRRLVLPVVLSGLFVVNLIGVVLPNALMHSNQVYFFTPPANLGKETPVGFVIDNPVLTYAEIWNAGTHFGLRNQTVFLPCCGEQNVRDNVAQWLLRNRDRFLLISDQAGEQVPELLRQLGIAFSVTLSQQSLVEQRLVPSSIYTEYPSNGIMTKMLRVYVPAS